MFSHDAEVGVKCSGVAGPINALDVEPGGDQQADRVGAAREDRILDRIALLALAAALKPGPGTHALGPGRGLVAVAINLPTSQASSPELPSPVRRLASKVLPPAVGIVIFGRHESSIKSAVQGRTNSFAGR